MNDHTRRIAELTWMPPEDMPEDYQLWLANLDGCSDIKVIGDTWKEADSENWHFDLIQYPLLRKLYDLARPNACLYLHLQAVANHTEWATLEEVDGKYCIEAFFFFPDDLLTSYFRIMFLLYQGYPANLTNPACETLLSNYPEEMELEQLRDNLQAAGSEVVQVPTDLGRGLTQRAEGLLAEYGFGFLEDLREK